MFLDNMLIAAKQVAILYLIVATGFVADKTKLFTEKAARLCTDLLFYIITPAVIINSFMEVEYNSETAREFFIALGCGALIHATGIVISLPFFRKGDPQKNCIFRYASAFGNCGYMGLPFASAILGAKGVFFVSSVIMSFHMFTFTYGAYILSVGNGKEKRKFDFKKIILNPGSLAVFVALPLFLLGVDLPEVIGKPISYVGSMNTPLAMLIFGTYIANTNMRDIFKHWQFALVAALKLIALPLIAMGAFKLFGLPNELLTALIIPASAPPANNTVMFSAKFNKDTGLASQTVAVVSFTSIVTMPIMIALAQM